MRTSLTEIAELERWIFKKGDLQFRLVTEARILSNPVLKEKAERQQSTYALVRQYGRQKLLEEIKSVEKELFNAPIHQSFRQRIYAIFKK